MKPSILLVFTAACLASACTGSTGGGGGTPGVSPGPAFDLVVKGPVVCPHGVDAHLCLGVTVTNRGTAGDGDCTLYAVIPSSNGDQSVTGPRVQLTGVRSGASVDEVLAWTNGVPTQNQFFLGDCSPGLRS